MRYPTVVALFVSCLFACSCAGPPPQTASNAPAASHPAPVYGEVVRGLQVSISPDQASYAAGDEVTLHVALRNAGDDDLVLNLGMMLANGKKQYATAVGLILTDASGQDRTLALMGSAVAGRIDDYLVPLPKGAVYMLETVLSDYWCDQSKEWRIRPAAGRYIITATFVGEAPQYVNNDMEAVKLIPVWTGDVASNQAPFTVSAK